MLTVAQLQAVGGAPRECRDPLRDLDARDFIEKLVRAELGPRSRAILAGWCFEGKTFREIGSEYQLPRSRIAEIVKYALQKLRRAARWHGECGRILYRQDRIVASSADDDEQERFRNAIELLHIGAEDLEDLAPVVCSCYFGCSTRKAMRRRHGMPEDFERLVWRQHREAQEHALAMGEAMLDDASAFEAIATYESEWNNAPEDIAPVIATGTDDEQKW